MSLWFVDMNQRTKKPGLWSASWCASCASCDFRCRASAVVLMGVESVSYWFARLAASGFAGAGAGLAVALPGTPGAGVVISPAGPVVVELAAAGVTPER